MTIIDTGAEHALDDGPGDAQLIAQVRTGSSAAFEILYRRHLPAARSLARHLAPTPTQADDLVSEAFAVVYEGLAVGRGPDTFFRSYVLTTLRTRFLNTVRKDRRLSFSDDHDALDSPVQFDDPALASFEARAVAKAYGSLPERWQTVLWHMEVEGQRASEVAAILGIAPNAVSALAYRAREGLREAYLQAHLAQSPVLEDECRFAVDRLGKQARGGLTARERGAVEDHLGDCDRCRSLWLELTELNSGLRAVVAPLILGIPLAGYLAGAHVHVAPAAAAHSVAAPHVSARTGMRSRCLSGRGARSAAVAGSVMAAAGIAAAVALSFHSPAQTAAAAAGPNPTPAAAAAQPAPAATAATAAPASVDATPPSGPVVVAPVQVEPIAVPVIAPPQAPAQRDDRRGGDPQPTDEGLPDAAPAESVEPTAPPASPETPDPGPVVDPGVGGGPKSGPLEPQAARLEVPIVPSFPGGQVDEGDRRTLVAFVHAGDEPRLVITGVPDGWTATFSGGCREGDGVSVCTLLDTVGTSPVTLDVALVDGAVPESGVATIALYSNDSNVPPADSYTVEFYGAPPTETPPAGPATEPDAPLAPPPGAPAAD